MTQKGPIVFQMVKNSKIWSKLVQKHQKRGVCRTAPATPGQFTFGQGVSQKTLFKENDNLDQDSKVGNKNYFCDNYRPKKYGALRTVHFSVHKSKTTKNHTLPN